MRGRPLTPPTLELRPCPHCGAFAGRVAFREEAFVGIACRACGLVYLGNPPDESTLYEDYHAPEAPAADAYAADSALPRLRELYAINAQRAARLHALRPGGRVLDVGCGRGYFLASARACGYAVHGQDVSERAVAYARAAFDLDAQTTPLATLADRGETFDVVTLWHVAEHFTDLRGALAEVYRLVAPGGLCAVEVPNHHSLKFVLSGGRWEGGNHPRYHRTFFTARTLTRALGAAGFAPVRRVRWSYAVPGHGPGMRLAKRALDAFALDAFLDVVAWKPR